MINKLVEEIKRSPGLKNYLEETERHMGAPDPDRNRMIAILKLEYEKAISEEESSRIIAMIYSGEEDLRELGQIYMRYHWKNYRKERDRKRERKKSK